MECEKNKQLSVLFLISIVYFVLIYLTNDSLTTNGELQKPTDNKNPYNVHRVPNKKMAITLLNKEHIQTFSENRKILDPSLIDIKNTNAVIPPLNNITFETNPVITQQNKVVYLTFDDGPKNSSNDLLSILNQYQVKATFFMLDGNIKRYPDAVIRMIQSGHSVGLHGVTHNRSQFYQSSQTVISEMDQTRNSLLAITGIDTHFIRTPFGSAPDMTDEYKKAVIDHGYLMWDWNVDSKDWYYRDHRFVDAVKEQVEKQRNQMAPIVILLHDQEETVAQIPALLDYLISQHYIFKAIDASMQPIQF
ncbi:polysaccharide deacetylase family protein [Bacillus sp. 1NLA3E]|uniref:polysaccharide deacetylase family protein n=1 Tax=Bacillus sp. 1NLA3E TaxID=666686 RepID=UPI000247F451|nr:polysaccharide deacetylase family protein [Bacillus sp. 1NLA3E]AGK53805.1 endo-1,4-beta-xylanase [Bacillus sp. 1NLA3E]